MVQDRFLGEKDMILLFNSNIVTLLLKTNVGREKTCFYFGCFNCSWEGGEVGKVRKVGWWSG